MGDVLHAMPAVAALRMRHPDWLIGWAIEPRWQALLQTETGAMPLVNRIHPVPTRDWNRRPFSRETLRKILAVRRDLRDAHYDICVDMQGLLRSAVIGRFAHAPRYAGSAHPREAVARRLYGIQVRTSAPHVIDRGCELLGGAIGEDLKAVAVPLPMDHAAEQWCDALLQKHGVARFAMLAPTAGWGAKQWPVERYGALALALAGAGITPLINAVKPNEAIAEAVRAASRGAAHPVACTLTQLTSLLRRAAVMIAGDTGPLHLAAALGRPVVGLYGPTDPRRTGPYGTRSVVIRHQASNVDHRRHAQPEHGLLQIAVADVMNAAAQVLA